MFIYQTKKLYNEDGDGPFDALVITNGEQGAKPAEVGQQVIAAIQATEVVEEVTTHNILVDDEFIVGEEPISQGPAFYQEVSNDGGDTWTFEKLANNFVEDSELPFSGMDLCGEQRAVEFVTSGDYFDRPFSNVEEVAAHTSEGNDGQGYELNVVTTPVLDKEDEPTGFYHI